ncbi:methionine--tRNA ligase [Candidatus Azambacteria bacterium RIFCSPLOWO2_02_FULL_42_10]|nr:MAG: methionine--tRNA ligase [Candidatus Azambacteria bacterium RIFCSPLOWO2_02_FULL_42_10]
MNKFFVTTSIPYANAPPHIGHALEFVQADVLARYWRSAGKKVFFLTGADEHGVKIARSAQKAGVTPGKFVNKNTAEFKKLIRLLAISNDDFIRTTDKKRHWPGAQKLWLRLIEAGDIYKKNYKGLYCVGHEAFVTEKGLAGGVCAIHKSKPEVIEEENYFFRLSKYSKIIESRIKNNELRIIPASRKNEILSLLKQGLEDISFSRPSKDLSWGIPVPGDKTHTMYVWCDALSNYITAIDYAEENDKFKKWWPADAQIIGKDILRFHAAIWPGMLLSAGLPLPKEIFVHGFITAGGEKMSKTIGNVADPFGIIKKYGADALRYYLLREIPPAGDGEFTDEKFNERYNADLAKGLGNLFSRVLTLAQKGKISPIENPKFALEIKKTEKILKQLMIDFKFNEALEKIWRLIALGDKYIDAKKPWSLDPNSKEFKKIIGELLSLIAAIGKLLAPFLPETAGKISKHIAGGKIATLFPRLK